jgi:1-aminocyclopropane-1-carboxylate deaminase/D-cysteine desulfhydrase-like pyridoxal-dependent ACC family enzyme
MKHTTFGFAYMIITFSLLAELPMESGEQLFIKNLNHSLMMPQNYFETLNTLANKTPSINKKVNSASNWLFSNYPKLADHIPYLKLGNLPTPILFLKKLSQQVNASVYLKHDGFTNTSSSMFGGNKIRKLEFLLADALTRGAESVLTFGAAGSNHVVATACYAKAVGLKCIAMLKKQPNAHVVRRNLLLMRHFNTELHLSPSDEMRSLQTIATFIENKNNQNIFPYFIPTGGSTPIGILGYVNAAFELKKQIADGLMPEPDYIYVSAGSFGTMVGLLLGIKTAGLKAQLKPILVEPLDKFETEQDIIKLFKETNQLLHNNDQSFPLFNITIDELNLNTDFTGSGYGQFTKDGKKAIEIIYKTEGIKLDGTYTAKAFAALLYNITNDIISKDKTILFWNTFCSDDFDTILETENYKQLPPCFHEYFEHEVQELDKK